MIMSTEATWIKRKDAPLRIKRLSAVGIGSKIIVFNQWDKQYGLDGEYESRLHSYDIHTDEWQEIMTCDDFSNSIDGTRSALDSKTNTLYLKMEERLDLIAIDLNTKKTREILSTSSEPTGSTMHFGFVLIDDAIHIIGGTVSGDTKHLCMKLSENAWNEVYDFEKCVMRMVCLAQELSMFHLKIYY